MGSRVAFLGLIILTLVLILTLQFMSQGMKEVASRGKQVMFKIPKSWTGEPDGNGVMFYGPEPDAGTLRLSVLTYQTPDRKPNDEPGIALIAKKEGVKIEKLSNGSYFMKLSKRGSRDGESLMTTYWNLERSEPNVVAIAMFTYTHVDYGASKGRFAKEVAMLDREIRNAVLKP